MHRLAHGPYIARIDDRGATLAELTHNGRNLIPPAPEGTPGSAATDPLYRGALLAPWPNRVADGTYRFKGAQYELPITEPDRHHAIHGLIHALLFAADPPELTPGSSPGSAPAPARAPASDRADAAGEHLTLRATLEPSPGYPWRLAVTVSYRLDDDGLSTEISAQNLSESEAPFGVGAHPYLVAGDGRADDWSLELAASARLEVDPERLIPTTLHPSAPFTGKEPLGTTALDHAFTELASAPTSAASTRTVQASTASTRTASTNAAPAGGDALQPVRLTAPDGSGVEVALGHGVRWVQVFTTDLGEDHPLTRRAVAVEPMSCSPDAFNAADHAFDTGLVALAPGVSWSMSWRIAALTGPAAEPYDVCVNMASTETVPAEPLGAGVIKRETRLADGRALIYFDDPDTTLPPERAVDARPLDPRPDTARMRYDVLTGDWISVATNRQNRAFLPPAHLDPLAPQTETNPSEIPSLYDVAVFENRSPSFGPGLPAADDNSDNSDNSGAASIRHPLSFPAGADPLELSNPSYGRCEVICFSPEHEGSFASLTATRARTVIEALADRVAHLSALPGVEQVFPFENRGREIGVTLPHPHGQIYGYPFVTPRTRTLLARIDDHGDDLFARILEREQRSSRVVASGEHWTAFVPYAARWPLEVHLMPHRHVADLAETTAAERDELAPFYLRLLRAVDALYDTPTPYIAAWHQAPVSVGRDSVRLRLELTSPRRAADKLKYLAGSEAAMGAWIGDVAPEAAAERLRDAVNSTEWPR